jgi:hypothetical protein
MSDETLKEGKFAGYPADRFKFVQRILMEELIRRGIEFEVIDPLSPKFKKRPKI